MPLEGHRGQSHSLYLHHISHLDQQGFTFIRSRTPLFSDRSLRYGTTVRTYGSLELSRDELTALFLRTRPMTTHRTHMI